MTFKELHTPAKTIPAKLIRPSNLDDKAKKIFNEQGVAEGRGFAYKEIEFVCANPEFPDATDPKLQKQMYAGLKQIPGVIPLFQDQSDYSEGQYSLSAIYKDRDVRGQILKLAKQLGVRVDLERPVTDDYVDRAIRGEHEGQQGVAESGADSAWSSGTDKITLQDILELTKDIKQINLPITDKLKSKMLQWDGNPEEIERINHVTVSNQFPILVMVDDQDQIEWILDGNHRLHKAIQSQAKTIPAKLIRPSNLDDKAKKIFNIKEQGVVEDSEQSSALASMVSQDQDQRNEYAQFVKSQAGGDWTLGAQLYARLKNRPSNDIFGDAARLNQFMKMTFDFDTFTHADWDNYWLLAQHCDDHRDFQKNALSIIKKYQGQDHSHYKYLRDRISVGLTGKQKYGTQNINV